MRGKKEVWGSTKKGRGFASKRAPPQATPLPPSPVSVLVDRTTPRCNGTETDAAILRFDHYIFLSPSPIPRHYGHLSLVSPTIR